jgi:hypothetical protein
MFFLGLLLCENISWERYYLFFVSVHESIIHTYAYLSAKLCSQENIPNSLTNLLRFEIDKTLPFLVPHCLWAVKLLGRKVGLSHV